MRKQCYFNSRYEVNKEWIVRHMINKKNLKPIEMKQTWYSCVNLSNPLSKNWFDMYSIHRLVAYTFIWWETDKVVNHLNWDRGDNRLVNLEICTHKENINHAQNVLWKKVWGRNKWIFWKGTPRSIWVIKYDKNMKKIKEYESIELAKKDTGIISIWHNINWLTKTAWWFIRKRI